MARNESIWCPSGGDWYACSTGTFFAGCCAVNPCSVICPTQHIYPAAFNRNIYGTFPDMNCASESNFYTCSGTSNDNAFFGCCKTNACTQNGCPTSDVTPGIIERPEIIDIWGDPSVNNMGIPPVTTALVTLASEPARTLAPVDNGLGFDRARGMISPIISIAAMMALCTLVALWLGWRKLSSHGRHTYESIEPAYSSSATVGPEKHDTHANVTRKLPTPAKDEIQRLGSNSVFILFASALAVLGMCGFLMFLWFGDNKNATWGHIMIRGWATRSVAITALVLRTCVDLQAAVACALLASLLLESNSGIHLHQTASMSTMRTGSMTPWTFARCVLEEFWRSTAQSRRNYHVYAMATCLLITTSVVQFSSTLLLSDLKPGPLVGSVIPSEVRPGLSYPVSGIERIARDSAWTTNPPNYATFGEYHETPTETPDGIVDTGILLRAFLPYAAAESRQSLATYTGNALTIDARVSCQAPSIVEFSGKGMNGQIKGIVSPTVNATRMESITSTAFECTVGRKDDFTICQLGQPGDGFMGSLKSQLEKSTAFGTAFLVIHGSGETATRREWQNLTFPETNTTKEASISLTLCFAPWDAAILDVALHSDSNGTEPLLQYWEGFEPSNVLTHLIPTAKNATRQVMKMQKPQSFLGDLPPPYRRPVVQSDMGGSSAAARGTNVPLPGNWSVFLTGTPLVTHLRRFESPPTQIISADPALAAIFTGAIEAGHSVEWALSSLITLLSMTNYYSQQPAFDRVDRVAVSFFENVLYPRNYIGLAVLMWTLVAHFTLVTLLLILFVTKTRLTLIGNAWSAFAQVMESQTLREYMAGASLTDDATLLAQLRNDGRGDLRARLVRRGEGAEVAVE